jgi:hypothetical protein
MESFGIYLFSLAIVINLFSFFYRYFWILNVVTKTKHLYKTSKYKISSENSYVWGFFTLFIISFIFTYLYSILDQEQGIYRKPYGFKVIYARWIAYSLSYALLIKSYKPNDFYITFFGIISMIFILFATYSIPFKSKIISILSSLFSIIIISILWFLPSNKIFHKDFKDKEKYGKILKTEYCISSSRNTYFLLFLILIYLINLSIWIISESNEIINEGLDFKNETIAYLGIDLVFVYTMTIYSFFISIIKKPIIDFESKDD